MSSVADIHRILVVDDDECIRELLRLHLSRAGYDVELAEDAIAAGHALMRGLPDLMVVDVEMPYMSGLELVSIIRADRSIPYFPIVFLTAVPNLWERVRVLNAAYVTKPVLADTLLAVVARQGRATAAAA